MQFQLNFTNVDMISSSPFGYDNLQIKFTDENIFKSANSEDTAFTIEKEQPPSVSLVSIKSIYPSEDYDKQRALLYVVLAVVTLSLLISSLTGRFESGIWSLINT